MPTTAKQVITIGDQAIRLVGGAGLVLGGAGITILSPITGAIGWGVVAGIPAMVSGAIVFHEALPKNMQLIK